jgi:uncharacterized membrane protein YvbJ
MILVVLAFHIHTMVLTSSLTRSSKSFVHAYRNNDTLSTVSTLMMPSKDEVVTRSDATLETSSCRLGFAV